MPRKALLTMLTATTVLVTGAALAANEQPNAVPPGHSAAVKDFGKLSADGTRAYQDLTLTRLAIFDGRVNDAKKFVADANSEFGKAKNDDSVFMKAEADMKQDMTPAKTADAKATPAKANDAMSSDAKPTDQGAKGNAMAAQGATQGNGGQDMSKSIAWLPVDGTVTLNEDYSMQPAKAKAVAEANKSLAKGDRKGAMDKLKLADVDVSVAMAVVPLKQTISDVQQAAQLIDSGKYYEGSQTLRAVQASTVFTVENTPEKPAASQQGGQQNMAAGQKPATH